MPNLQRCHMKSRGYNHVDCVVDERSITFWKNPHLQMLYVNSYCENNCKIPFDPHAMPRWCFQVGKYTSMYIFLKLQWTETIDHLYISFRDILELWYDRQVGIIGIIGIIGTYLLEIAMVPIWIDISQLSLPFSHQGNPCGMRFLDLWWDS